MGEVASSDVVCRYFPTFSAPQRQQLSALEGLYTSWNAKINVISRQDIGNLYLHHVLPSLALFRAFPFSAGTTILDVGTGGGFPGIPLAIACPQCQFTLIDGTAKKIRVVTAISAALGLENVVAAQRRAEDERGRYDFIVSRGVMPLPLLVRAVQKNISAQGHNAFANGILVLKGGNIESEVAPFRRRAEVVALKDFFAEEWFAEKYIIYLPC